MDIQFKSTKYEPTPEIIKQVEKQIGALDRFIGEGTAKAVVELERAVGGMNKGDIWRAELTVEHDGKRYRVESTKAKLDHAVTTVARDMARELGRVKKKGNDLVRKGGASIKGFLRGFGGK